MDPWDEPFWITQLRELAPGLDQCLLDRILGGVRVAEDAGRDGQTAVADPTRQRIEGVSVAGDRRLDLGHGHRASPRATVE
jgi:hypothetical protein